MTQEELQSLCKKYKGKYLRIDYDYFDTRKTVLFYSPKIFSESTISSSDVYKISRKGKHLCIKTQVERVNVYFFRLEKGMRIYKTPYNVKTAKNLIKKILL